jgi:RHS repeat-associated protein
MLDAPATETPTPTATATESAAAESSGPVTIDYTYDALNRLTDAIYSNGMAFYYSYDAAGNVLAYTRVVDGISTVTIYTYDDANQLLTATGGETTWYYTYNGNGNLVMSSPSQGEANGATRNTYNKAGYLVKVEEHNGTAWQTQSEMRYDGLGNRLEMTSYTDGVGETIRYQLDNGQPLAAVGTESTSYYLYGRGVIGTKTDSWAYVLQDGLGSTRQLATHEGVIVMSVAYTPWGDVLEYYGSGGIDFGYLGGVYDAGTGLLYMGNGRYYDPATGRFLTRGAGQGNPYKPGAFDPAGLMVAPLAVLGLVLGRKKKRGKWDNLIVLLVVCVVVGMSVSACDTGVPSTPTEPQSPIAAPPDSQGDESGETNKGKATATPYMPTLNLTPSWCILMTIKTPAPTPSPTPAPFYNGQGAVDWAMLRWKPELMMNEQERIYIYDKLDEKLSNCANFVSYALAEGGGLKENSIWERPKGNNDIVDLRGAWTRPAELMNFLINTHGFRKSRFELDNNTFAGSAYHEYWDDSRISENSLTVPIRDDPNWETFLSNIRNETKKGDLIFFEDWHDENSWHHVGLITGEFESPTLENYGKDFNYSLEEPLMVDHHGRHSLEKYERHQRSIGDTNSLYIRRVTILHAP